MPDDKLNKSKTAKVQSPKNSGRSAKFPSKNRIKDRFDFLRLQKAGEKLYSKHFLVSITESKIDCSRLGIAITKKVAPRAVDRNKVKRRVREVFRLNQHRLSGNFDIVVVARRDSHLCPITDVEREVIGALSRGGYLKRT